ncbi:leucine-rich repeat-containing protein 63 isoform X2 [Oncorhynchus nerka]|uniref:leucine-rich repeat-containing protein 63 isoform X2 n=1 Tax=Oncorhynchus nerka TaxID=8023 RepID=UPI001131A53F|nr:leucine-rich repeat-containing protein 63 isoform X2 [Oncorhynchus nerka]
MPSERARLLRRPLPPKKNPPIVKSLPSPILSGTIIDSLPSTERMDLKDSATGWSESSCHMLPLWDYDPAAFRVAPTPLTSVPSMLIPEIIEGFPCKRPRTLPKIPLLDLLKTDPRYIPFPPSFSFNDFLRNPNGGCGAQSLEGLKKVALSRCNYRKLVGLFLMELHKGQQTEVSKQLMSTEKLPEAKSRIPQKQIICELAALIRMEVQTQMMCRRSCLGDGTCRSEQKSVEIWVPPGERQAVQKQENLYLGTEVILNSVTTKHFQGSRRTHSPFRHSGEGINPSELAILDCLTEGGKALTLKAHFIALLPDLTPLAQSLLYLNLSFNDFTIFPVEVYELTQLEVLKMRDNPIEEIPTGIHRLTRLKTFVISFCKITSLPSELYQLPTLQFLDVSYNLLSSLTNDIRKLRTLEYLNVEGNQLPGLPCGALRLSLTQLRISNNYMHPYFWKSCSWNSPQDLQHSATMTLSLTDTCLRYASLPPEAQMALSRVGVCDCCRGPMYGPGLKVIRPCYNIFGLHRVPFVFYACTPACHWNFKIQTKSLSSLLYGEDTTHNSEQLT